MDLHSDDKVSLHGDNEKKAYCSESDDAILRTLRSILNKITPQTFQLLSQKALNLDLSTEKRLSKCSWMIVERASSDHKFSVFYADLSKVLSPIRVEWTSSNGSLESTTFRKVFLTQCQQQYEWCVEEACKDETLKKRYMGHLILLAHLYCIKMITDAIMFSIISTLLQEPADEIALECFAKLMMIAGKECDKPCHKVRMNSLRKRVEDIVEEGKISKRVQFLLQDVLDMWGNGWRPRQIWSNQQVKTKEQVRAEVKSEENELILQYMEMKQEKSVAVRTIK